MRKFAVLAALLLLTVGSADPPANNPPANGQTPQAEFVFNLYRSIVQGNPEKNVTVSPYGVGRILDLARHGAAGETRTEIEQVLGYTEWVQWETRSDDTLTIADALWIQQGYPILPEFLQTARENFGSSIEQADFARNPNEAVRRINAWCSANTKGKIPSLFNRLDTDTRLVLANAIHFSADWKIQFNRNRTRESDFTLLNGEKSRTRLMSQEILTKYGETDDTLALELLYKDESYAMVLLLPKNPAHFLQWESEMTTQKFNFLRRSMSMDYLVNIRMPKFTMESDLPLNGTLQQLGMRTAFSGEADFSKMTPNHAGLFVTDVQQKTFVEVDETGTRAAAVTGIGIGCSAPPQPAVFHADRPFLYAIVKGDSILFLGRFVGP
jgi:serpin B